MRERRSETRLLCAELVEVIWRDSSGREKRRIGNLEDICANGICVQLETRLETGTAIRMLSENGELAGIVRYALYRDEGYFVGIELEGDSQWSATEFVPEHLLNPDDLQRRTSSFHRTLLRNTRKTGAVSSAPPKVLEVPPSSGGAQPRPLRF